MSFCESERFLYVALNRLFNNGQTSNNNFLIIPQLLVQTCFRMGTDHTGVTFVVHLRRKRFFYVLNTIIPVVMLSCLNVLVFILPSDCGERMALAVTVLLAFTVYLGIISDNIPKTSESLSLLGVL